MCYSIPGKVIEISGSRVLVEYFGETRNVINEIPGLKPGDFISAQGGFSIRIVPHKEALATLETWRELFGQLREIDEELSAAVKVDQQGDDDLEKLLEKAASPVPLERKEILRLLSLSEEKSCERLFSAANFLRHRDHGNACCIHGIIEISNYCRRGCRYCGISTSNRELQRYRMSRDEIVDAALGAVRKHNFQALVLQSGEDPAIPIAELCDAIRTIRRSTPVLICASFGEVGLDGLSQLYEAGARALLMRFETSNNALFKELHPGQELDARLEHIRHARRLGYLIMTGALIGLPGQSDDDIVDDIMLAGELGAEMFTFGPFLPHPGTPLRECSSPDELKVLKTLAMIRLVHPKVAKIPVTSAFESMGKSCRRKALMAGANSLMINLTPARYRRLYSIYPAREQDLETIPRQISAAVRLLRELGRAPTDLGVSAASI